MACIKKSPHKKDAGNFARHDLHTLYSSYMALADRISALSPQALQPPQLVAISSEKIV